MENDTPTSTSIAGKIDEWFFHENGSIYGKFVEDHKGRFIKDSWIITPTIVSIEDDLAKTLTSTYKLGTPHPDQEFEQKEQQA